MDLRARIAAYSNESLGKTGFSILEKANLKT